MTASIGSTINVIDLFAGCGGFTQGFHGFKIDGVSPFRTVGAVEFNYAAASTYAVNFAEEARGAEHVFAGDIRDWDPNTVGADVDVILGGPPCQGFSGLGKEDVGDPRNKLWREYAKVVEALNPKIFVIENVDRFLKSVEYGALLAQIEGDGYLKNYRLVPKVLNAADYGVPQARKRAIVLATRRDIIDAHPDRKPMSHPPATHRKQEKDQQADAIISVNDVFSPWVPASTVFERTPKTTVTTVLPERTCSPLGGKLLPGPFKTTDLHVGRNPTRRSLDRYAEIPPGGNRHNLPPHLSTKNWLRHRNGSGDVMGRAYWDRPSVTIRTEFYKPEKGRYLHPFEDRPITHLEAALLQGFPEDFQWCGSKVQIATQIGNAVPIGLSTAIARELYRYLAVAGQLSRPAMQKSA